MKDFIKKILIFSAIVSIVFLGILLQTDGNSSYYYLKFTSSKQKNLVLGTSRSSQGIMPGELQKRLKKCFFNYSFTNQHSPFGPYYLESIKRKLKDSIKNGSFIVTIDPWALSVKKTNINDDIRLFREKGSFIDKTNCVSSNPNFEFLLENLEGNTYELLLNKKKKFHLHNDGWLEIDVIADSILFNKKLQTQLHNYNKKSSEYRLSPKRIFYLKQLIDFLNKHGDVYIFRLPISPEILELEKRYCPNFESKISNALLNAEEYFDLSMYGTDLLFTDGVHLHKSSSFIVTHKISDLLQKHNNIK